MSGFIDIVFDGPPSHDSGRFVEVEDADGKSIRLGEWVTRPNDPTGWAALRIPDPRPDTADADPVERKLPPDPHRHIGATWANPEYDPRNPSGTALMIEAGFRDLVNAVVEAGERIGEEIAAHATELGRQRP